MTWLNIAIFVVSCLVLVRAGLWVVKSLIKISQFLGWREFMVSSVLMAFSTSLPEILVAVSSSFSGMPELSFGNVIGSNIIALTLVIGIGAILGGGIAFKGKTLQRATIYAAMYSLLPLILMLDNEVSRTDAFLLFFALIFYFAQLLAQEERFTKIFSNHFARDWLKFKGFLKNLGTFLLGVIFLVLSANGIVYSASHIASATNSSLIIVGSILVALGTSLPELAFGIRSVTMGHKQLILGDVMGSVVINSTLVLGLAALISPLKVNDFTPYLKGAFFTLATCIFFLVFAKSDRKITKKEALILLTIYVLFLITEIA